MRQPRLRKLLRASEAGTLSNSALICETSHYPILIVEKRIKKRFFGPIDRALRVQKTANVRMLKTWKRNLSIKRCMAIRSTTKKARVILLFFLLFFPAIYGKRSNFESNADIVSAPEEPSKELVLSTLELPDKIFTLYAPYDELLFESVYLEKNYMYYFNLEIVSPHACTVEIIIFDPEDSAFKIFEAPLNYYDESQRYYRIPFGTALSGSYDFLFKVTSTSDLNLYIRVEQGVKCLYDKLTAEETNNFVLYKINKFDYGKHVEHNLELDQIACINSFSGECRP